jgi:hypothetical protein
LVCAPEYRQSVPQQVIVQVPGNALRMSAALFKAEFDQREHLRRVVLRLVSAALAMTSQNAACNRLHSVEQRCARWLLEASNRIASDTMPMTHEFLASLLGVRRAGVTETAGHLQRSGMVRSTAANLPLPIVKVSKRALANATWSTTSNSNGSSRPAVRPFGHRISPPLYGDAPITS